MKKLFVLLCLLAVFNAFSQNKPAYLIFRPDGSQATWTELTEKAAVSNVVLFGELHNNPICHWLQFELTQSLFNAVGQKLVLGAEMFETDNQLLLNEYLDGKVAALEILRLRQSFGPTTKQIINPWLILQKTIRFVLLVQIFPGVMPLW